MRALKSSLYQVSIGLSLMLLDYLFIFLYFIVFICKFYKEQAKRYYKASLNTFYIIKGCTHTHKRQRG